MPPLALVGNLSRDVVDGGPPRIGGAPFYAGRAWHALGTHATLVTRCAAAERNRFARELAPLGLPVVLLDGKATTAFSFHYDGEVRVMRVEQVGDTWTEDDVAAVAPAGWVHVAPLLRSDFPAATVAALARGRRLSLDGQGLVRVAQPGPLRLDADFDEAVLEHVQILKLAEEEADVIGAVDRLGVREVVVTYGHRGSTVYVNGSATRVGAWPVAADPTGSGDAFAAAYLAGRAGGLTPVSAARRATAVVAALLTAQTP